MERIERLCDEIVKLWSPQKIILFSRKTGLGGELSSFKLCIVADVEDRRSTEREIYLRTECDIPYDVLIYRPREWDEMRVQDGSFAQKIDRTGRVIYG